MERTESSDRDGDEWGKVEEVDVDTAKEEHRGAKAVVVDTSRGRERGRVDAQDRNTGMKG